MHRKLAILLTTIALAASAGLAHPCPAWAAGKPGKEPGRALRAERKKTHDRKVRFLMTRAPHQVRKTHPHKGLLNPNRRGMSLQAEREHTWLVKNRRLR